MGNQFYSNPWGIWQMNAREMFALHFVLTNEQTNKPYNRILSFLFGCMWFVFCSKIIINGLNRE